MGVAEGGSETWCDRELYCLKASVGAPPDILGPLGQNWGLPPMDPHIIAARAYEPFIDLLRANMFVSVTVAADLGRSGVTVPAAAAVTDDAEGMRAAILAVLTVAEWLYLDWASRAPRPPLLAIQTSARSTVRRTSSGSTRNRSRPPSATTKP